MPYPDSSRVKFVQWIEVFECDKATGKRIRVLHEFSDYYSNHNDISISTEKSITSTSDTMTIEIQNHRILEDMYRLKKAYFDQFRDKLFEVDYMAWYWNPMQNYSPELIQNWFTGELSDIYAKDDSSITDQALVLKTVAGDSAATRAEVKKNYASGAPYRDIVEDMLGIYETKHDYKKIIIDDPDNKLAKVTKRPRTYHGKVSDALNDIAKDSEMVWSFDSVPWTYAERRPVNPLDPTAWQKPKHVWYADKRSVYDPTGLHAMTGTGQNVRGINALELDGGRGKVGRIGYTKSQFTFDYLFEPAMNPGMPVLVSDVGTMEQYIEFLGRVNRTSCNNQVCHCECSYIDPATGLADLEKDAKGNGALVL